MKFLFLLQPMPAAKRWGGGNSFFKPQKALGDDCDDDDDLSDLFCPLTLELMTDPVVCAGKHSQNCSDTASQKYSDSLVKSVVALSFLCVGYELNRTAHGLAR